MKALTVVAVALVLAIFLGLGLNFTQQDEQRVSYEQVADITPTVEHQPVNQWASLSPTANWTGYSPQSGFTYTQTPDGTVNRYRISPELPSTTTEIQDVRTLTAYRTMTASSSSVHFLDIGDGVISNATITGNGYGLTTSITPTSAIHLIELSTVASVGGNDRVEIVFSEPCCIPLIDIGSYGAGVGATVNLWIADLFGTDYAHLAKKVVYNVTGRGESAVKWYSGYDAAGNPVWSFPGNSQDAALYVVWGGEYVTGLPDPGTYQGVFSNSTVSVGPDPSITSVTVTPYDPDASDSYMDVRYGVQIQRGNSDINAGERVTWDNGYTNGSLTVIIRTDSGSISFFEPVTVNGATVLQYLFQFRGNGVTEKYVETNAGRHIIGSGYPAVAVTLDAINQEIRITSILAFSDFQNYSLAGSYTETDSYSYLKPISQLRFYLTGVYNTEWDRPVTMGIVDTIVGTDPSSVLWLDPIIKPRVWFPGPTSVDYSVLIRSVAASGDALIINGTSYDISDGQISVGGSSYPLNKMSIDYVGGHVVLKVSTKTGTDSIDLGAVTSYVISGTGIWFMQMDLRTISTETVQVFQYDPDAWDKSSIVIVLVIFMGLCTVLAMWAIHAHSFGGGEVAIIIGAVVIAWVVLGAFV